MPCALRFLPGSSLRFQLVVCLWLPAVGFVFPMVSKFKGRAGEVVWTSWAAFRESGAPESVVLISEVPDCSILLTSPAVSWHDDPGRLFFLRLPAVFLVFASWLVFF